MICESHDDKGNIIVYEYKKEDSACIAPTLAHERNRHDGLRSANRYLKKISYGNRIPYYPTPQAKEATPLPTEWFFEIVLDYGEHDQDAPTLEELREWDCRNDPFSSYRAGFEVRTYRLCQRVLLFHNFADEPNVGHTCIVRSTDFTYYNEKQPNSALNPIYSFLLSVTQRGYKRKGAGYIVRPAPSLEFEYTEPTIADTVHAIESDSLENLP